MQAKRSYRLVISLGVFLLGSFCFILMRSTAKAQSATPQLLITWQASNSYAPPSYSGKILPNQESQITASLQAISPQGTLIDLSGQTIYWYLNDVLLGGGIGGEHITFRPNTDAPNTITLRVEVPNYPSGLLISEIAIPIVQPDVVIDAPYPQGQFSQSPIIVQALPYFFNTSSSLLSFAWSVNGQTVSNTENPQTLQISMPQSTPAGFAVNISLSVQGTDQAMAANNISDLTYGAQP